MAHLRLQWREAAQRTLQPVKDNGRLGKCYELAAQYALDHMGEHWSIVHGTIQGERYPGLGMPDKLLPPLHHAWCWNQETDEMWEPATNAVYDADAFEELYRPKFDNVFEPGEWQETVMHYRHYGPWDGTAPPVKASR